MSKSEKKIIQNELNFQINSGGNLTFKLDSDKKAKIHLKEVRHGKVTIENNEISYVANKGYAGVDVIICEYLIDNAPARTTVNIRIGHHFKAKSHILNLLGEELIGSDNLAIFELVKNSYDADADVVTIKLNNLNTPKQEIIVEDDGRGMDLNVLEKVWLEIGTDFKRGGKRAPSPKYGRSSLGEKGVGRLAIHKLGKKITLETQAEGSKISHRISLNWSELIEGSEFIQDAFVNIESVNRSLFPKGKGTRIIIQDPKKEHWSRKDLRDLARKTYSIKSPFQDVVGKFDIEINANDHHQAWFDDVKESNAILENALYTLVFTLKVNDKGKFAKFEGNYRFNPPEPFGITARNGPLNGFFNLKDDADTLKINPKLDSGEEFFDKDQKHLKNEDLEGIGDIEGRFYVYNLLGPVLRAFGQTNAIKTFVHDNSGVKIFRDGIRVYNYGERSDDWLGLDLARVQKLGERFSKNTVVGAIGINLKSSHGTLKEKTNREGFDENQHYLKFRNICNQIFDVFQRELAQPDREKIQNYLEGIKPVRKVGLSETITELEEKLKEKNLDKELSPLLRRVEKDYNEMRDVMLNSGMSGLNLGLVFHEVDREVKFINADLINSTDINFIKQRVANLIELLEGFSPILRQNQLINLHASELVQRAAKINNPRFGFHKVIFSSPLVSKESQDFVIKGPGNLLISAVSNIIDNSIYWVSSKRELVGPEFKSAIQISSDLDSFSGPAIVIADNGPGFSIEPEDLITPFRTTRPGGMGLGLYFVNMVMEMFKGQLQFPERSETKVPAIYDGAIIALVFPKTD